MRLFKYYVLILALSLLPLWSFILYQDLPHTHDGAVHLPRMAAYYKALTDGQIFPRWAGDLNYGYGLPLFNFIYHTPYLISALFIGLGLSLVTSFKLVIIISYLLSGIFIFQFANYLFKSPKKALLVATFYQFSPFRLVEMLVRGSFGEMYAYTFLPLAMLGIVKTLKTHEVSHVLLASTAIGLLIISHNSISLVFFILVAMLGVALSKDKKDLIWTAVALLGGLFLSAFYWIPALLEHKYTYGDLLMKNLYKSHFPPFINFFVPNFFNIPALQTGGVSIQIGIFHIGAVFLAAWALVRKRLDSSTRRLFMVSLGFFIVSLFFMSTASLFFWQNISLLRQFQFPWRLLAVVSIVTALCAVSYLSLPVLDKKPFFFLLLFTTVISTAYYWYPPLGFDRITTEDKFWSFALNTTYFGETDVIWSAGPAKTYPKSPVKPIAGNASISNFTKRSNIHTFSTQSSSGATLVDNTQYFPGWRAYVDNQKTPIEFQDQNWRGLITFPIPPGHHTVVVKFEKSIVQYVSELLTGLSFLFSTLVLLFSFKNVSWLKKK